MPASHGASAPASVARPTWIAAAISGVIGMPTREHHVLAGEARERAVALAGARPRAPPRWRSSAHQQRRAGARAGDGDERVDRLVGRARRASRAAAGMPGVGPSGSMWMRERPPGAIIANVSISGPRSRSGCEQRGAGGLVAEVGAVDGHDQARPARNSGMSGSGGTCIRRALVVTSSGAVRGPRGPGLEDLGAALPRPEHHAGVDLGQRVQARSRRR